MEQFHHGHHVRLRSRVHGTYLHADEDGYGVKLRTCRVSMNAAWAVHLYQGQNGQFLLLHSAAYGRYLAATDAEAPLGHRGLRVEQRNYNHPEVEPIVWQAMLSESEEEVYLRNAGGRRLRANGRNWNTGATVDNVDDLDNISRKMLWVVEQIPAMEIIPHLPSPTGIPHLTLCSRLIMYVLQNAYGAFVAHGSFMFRGRSVFRLRKKLVRKMRASVNVEACDILMCLPTRDGRLFPLVVDLPSNNQNLHIVVIAAGTPAEAALRYADVDA